MTEPAPYTDEDARLVAGMIRGYVLGNLPDQHCDRLARQIVAELERAGRLRDVTVGEVMAYELGREDARRQIAEALRKRAEAFGSYDARDALLEFAEDIHDRRVGPWVPVPEPDPDMSTAPNPSVGAHFEAHSAHIPDVPEEKP